MDSKNKGFKSRLALKPKPRTGDMIFGIRVVLEAIDAGRDLEKVFIRKNLKSDLVGTLRQALKATHTPASLVPAQKLDSFTKKNHQGVVAFVSPVKYHTVENLVQRLYEEGRVPFVVALDGLTDVRNFGAIARTAACVGADGIIIPVNNSVQVNADGIKTSAGALHHIPVCRTAHMPQALLYLKNSGLRIIGCTEQAGEPISRLALDTPVAIVMGSEDTGISQGVLKVCDQQAKIPLLGKLQSLNVSVAAGMLMYEVIRQRYQV